MTTRMKLIQYLYAVTSKLHVAKTQRTPTRLVAGTPGSHGRLTTVIVSTYSSYQ